MHQGLMLFPNPVGFSNRNFKTVDGYHLLENIQFPKNTYYHLHTVWNTPYQLPAGYDCYVVSWHLDQIDYEWLFNQQVDGKIFVLSDFNDYQKKSLPHNVHLIKWLYWHVALDKMIELFGTQYQKDIKYKTSAFCNRVTQSKMLITTALLEKFSESERLISLSDWIEGRSVHHWQKTGNQTLDCLQDVFVSKYLGKTISIDNFDNSMNYQGHTANPSHPAYQNTALHFNNESFHYSLMVNDQMESILPGPHLSEKTFKCLLGGTAFISVGQFDVYRTLSDLGLKFQYNIDLSFDSDPGNLSRLEKIVNLIDNIKHINAVDLYEMTKDSTRYNQDWIISGEFYKSCEKENLRSLEIIRHLL